MPSVDKAELRAAALVELADDLDKQSESERDKAAGLLGGSKAFDSATSFAASMNQAVNDRHASGEMSDEVFTEIKQLVGRMAAEMQRRSIEAFQRGLEAQGRSRALSETAENARRKAETEVAAAKRAVELAAKREAERAAQAAADPLPEAAEPVEAAPAKPKRSRRRRKGATTDADNA